MSKRKRQEPWGDNEAVVVTIGGEPESPKKKPDVPPLDHLSSITHNRTITIELSFDVYRQLSFCSINVDIPNDTLTATPRIMQDIDRLLKAWQRTTYAVGSIVRVSSNSIDEASFNVYNIIDYAREVKRIKNEENERAAAIEKHLAITDTNVAPEILAQCNGLDPRAFIIDGVINNYIEKTQ